jgi:hypothetical protein
MEIDQVKLSKTFKKYCSAQDLGGSEKVSPATGVNGIMHGSKRDGTPIANGFLPPLFSKDFFVILGNKEV